VRVFLTDNNATELFRLVGDWKPDFAGFQIWTGYHLDAFVMCDRVRAMGTPVIIGGPHATYFAAECAKHADHVVVGEGFRMLRQILVGDRNPGEHFDPVRLAEGFPLPHRAPLYDAYPQYADSPIKSIFCSVGCPFKCTYCYAPKYNEMYGGFRLEVRPVSDIIAEARAILERWPLKMVYFQDDIFGLRIDWLEQFSHRWRTEVGVPWHCQIRLELTRKASGDKRLDLFAAGGCSGITLAIESGNQFLRDHVLFRHMPEELILEGCHKVQERGMTLRTEQILAVPFSSTETDLATLDLNNRIQPTMAWTSILAPYGGTAMGKIASDFGFYAGNNDDLSETFFDSSVLHHMDGPAGIEEIVSRVDPAPEALLRMSAKRRTDGTADVYREDIQVGTIEHLDESANRDYCAKTVRLQRLFNFLSRVPRGRELASKLMAVPDTDWSWINIGRMTTDHVLTHDPDRVHAWAFRSPLPAAIAANPFYFIYFPASGVLADSVIESGLFEDGDTKRSLDELGSLTRHHLFDYGLYGVADSRAT
jgi:anaerobic magnesium-protoporphyrin IX monomethyl ester cyclase